MEHKTRRNFWQYANFNKMETLENWSLRRDEMDPSGNTALAFASREGNSEMVAELLNQNFDVNKFGNPEGRTPLSWAIKNRRYDIIQILLKASADINISDHDGHTPLTYTIRYGHIDSIKEVISYGASVTTPDRHGFTPLVTAAIYQTVDIVKLLLEHHVKSTEDKNKDAEDKNRKKKKEEIINGTDSNGDNLLTHSLKNGDVEIFKYLLELKAALPEKHKKIPLINYAVQYKYSNINLIKYIISISKNVNSVDLDGNTTLTIAVKNKRMDVVRYLIEEYQADVCKCGQKGTTPLSAAVETDDMAVVRYLLSHGAEPTIQSAFLVAVEKGNLDVVKLLKERGASVNSVCCGFTPLSKAVDFSRWKIANYLLEMGANNNLIKNEKVVDLVLVDSVHSEAVEVLIKLHIDVDASGEGGYNLLTKATEVENFKTIKLLVENGANINLKDKNGKYPLSIAASNGSFQIVKYLIESGASSNLARKEINDYQSWNDDFRSYMKLLKKPRKTVSSGSRYKARG